MVLQRRILNAIRPSRTSGRALIFPSLVRRANVGVRAKVESPQYGIRKSAKSTGRSLSVP